MSDNYNLDNLTPDQNNEILDRIIYLRKVKLKLSQEAFADELNTTQAYISFIESRKRPLQTSLLLQISYTFNINLDWLFFGTGGNENIFAEATVSDSFALDNALSVIQQACHASDDDIQFITRYLSMSNEKRKAFLKAISALASFYGA